MQRIDVPDVVTAAGGGRVIGVRLVAGAGRTSASYLPNLADESVSEKFVSSAIDVPDMSAIRDWVTQHLDEVLIDIDRLVRIESFSADKTGLHAALSEVEDLAQRRLGNAAVRMRYDGGAYGDVLRLIYGGVDAEDISEPMLVVSHYDTVWPKGTLANWPIVRHGNEITAPGIFDMKSGLVCGVWALAACKALDVPAAAVEFLFTGDEEVGSPFSQSLIEETARAASGALVLEASINGTMKTGRKGVGIFGLTARGVSAHAGLEPEKGASAVHTLAKLVGELIALARPEIGTTINVGTFNGGTGTNVVAAEARISIDIRLTDPAEMARLDAEFAKLQSSDPRVALLWDGGWNRPPMVVNDKTVVLRDKARAVATGLGYELQDITVGGGSDGNFISAVGCAVLDGLGPGGGGAHATHEHIDVTTIPQQICLIAGLLAR
ncbi:M20/M25/M40 family metallo-hydrolase [Saxibacter everestensis]|uniref:M20/M25/M40 family metallo-hydrolase n=1 Tax=Saxibacter everestensis TaxID=2909229 RepID=A0ABY8QTA2_9MICO|nr:M20/M25/M40 family metallo-hydrolase [Brevibacteriaceae bacterium ZFBP1038]